MPAVRTVDHATEQVRPETLPLIQTVSMVAEPEKGLTILLLRTPIRINMAEEPVRREVLLLLLLLLTIMPDLERITMTTITTIRIRTIRIHSLPE